MRAREKQAAGGFLWNREGKGSDTFSVENGKDTTPLLLIPYQEDSAKKIVCSNKIQK